MEQQATWAGAQAARRGKRASGKRWIVGAAFAGLLVLVGCGSDSDGSATSGDAANGEASADAASPPANGGASGSGTLTIDGEAVEVSSVGCMGQASSEIDGYATLQGTDSTGQNVELTVTWYNETSLSKGDEVRLGVGDGDGPGSDYSTTLAIGTVPLENDAVSARDVTLDSYGPAGTVVVSFELSC